MKGIFNILHRDTGVDIHTSDTSITNALFTVSFNFMHTSLSMYKISSQWYYGGDCEQYNPLREQHRKPCTV